MVFTNDDLLTRPCRHQNMLIFLLMIEIIYTNSSEKLEIIIIMMAKLAPNKDHVSNFWITKRGREEGVQQHLHAFLPKSSERK